MGYAAGLLGVEDRQQHAKTAFGRSVIIGMIADSNRVVNAPPLMSLEVVPLAVAPAKAIHVMAGRNLGSNSKGSGGDTVIWVYPGCAGLSR